MAGRSSERPRYSSRVWLGASAPSGSPRPPSGKAPRPGDLAGVPTRPRRRREPPRHGPATTRSRRRNQLLAVATAAVLLIGVALALVVASGAHKSSHETAGGSSGGSGTSASGSRKAGSATTIERPKVTLPPNFHLDLRSPAAGSAATSTTLPPGAGFHGFVNASGPFAAPTTAPTTTTTIPAATAPSSGAKHPHAPKTGKHGAG